MNVHKNIRSRAVHSDQIGRKCDQIFTDAIIFEHALAICDLKNRQLVAKQKYCDYHKILKNWLQICNWLLEQALK